MTVVIADVVAQMIEALVASIKPLGTAIGSGIADVIENLLFDVSTAGAYSLSVFGTVVLVFAGISLAFGLSRLCVKFITGLGSTNRM